MAKNSVTNAALALKIKRSEAHVSRLLSGRQAFLADSDFIAISKAASPKRFERAELVRAWCLDRKIGPGSELVKIVVIPHPR